MALRDVLRQVAPRVSWTILGCLFLAIVVSFYMMFIVVNDRYMGHKPWYEMSAPCEQPTRTIEAMASLAFITTDILNEVNIPHSLCYGTLWGALRNGRILPWDNNVDFCVMREHLDQVGWDALYSAFKGKDLELVFDGRHGEYNIIDGSAQLVLNVFYTTVWDEVLHDGWENRLLWFFQEQPLSIPKQLLSSPYLTVEFHGRQMPVPHDGIEILKYLYKDDWWLEKAPPGCKPTS